MVDDRRDLCQNIKSLQVIDKRLDQVPRTGPGAGIPSKDTLLGPSNEYDIFAIDIETSQLPIDFLDKISNENDSMALTNLRKHLLQKQAQIKSSISATQTEEKFDEEKARHRRHDYGTFLRKWMSALAEEEVLGNLVG